MPCLLRVMLQFSLWVVLELGVDPCIQHFIFPLHLVPLINKRILEGLFLIASAI